MKLVLVSTLAALAGLGGFALVHAAQLPAAPASAPARIAWSNPALVVDCGVQTRYGLAPRPGHPAAQADVVVRFEPIPATTLQALRQTHANLNCVRRPVTEAHVIVDVIGDAAPARVFRAVPSSDGSGALEARVTAPIGGWYQQPLRLGYAASSQDRVLFTSDAVVTLGP